MRQPSNQILLDKDTLIYRINLYQKIRQFFMQRAVQEVETPILSCYGSTDLHIDSFSSVWQKEDVLYLHTSPEFYMKRLLANGFGDCFQIGKVFRNEPQGNHHRPEFSLLEWYRVGFSLLDLMQEVIDLIISINPAWQKLHVEYVTYYDAFKQIDIDVFLDELEHIKLISKTLCGYLPNLSENKNEWLDFLLVTQIEPKLGVDHLTFLTDYPADMAALAKIETNEQGYLVAKRFELYYQGIELANGFDELTDAVEQKERFIKDNLQRTSYKKPQVPHDELFIDALYSGMPNCTGVALGLDRLIMLFLGKKSINEVTL